MGQFFCNCCVGYKPSYLPLERMHFVHFYGVLVFLSGSLVGDETTDCGPEMMPCPSLDADCVPLGKCPEVATEVEDDVPAANQTRVGRWDNGWDDPLHFECPLTGYPIIRIRSYHSNRAEDRRFKFYCQKNRVPYPGSYRWFMHVNRFDQRVDFRCPNGGFLTGASSYHSNRHEDRVWSFQCFVPRNACHYNCDATPANDWDKDMDFRVQRDKVIRGVVSTHSNRHEDRKWTFIECKNYYQ